MIKDGAKMSKSRGNVVNPDEYVAKFGADTLRLYVMFLGPMDSYPDFRDTGIEGMQRFVGRLWKLFTSFSSRSDSTVTGPGFAPVGSAFAAASRNSVISKLNQTVKKVSDDMGSFKYNTAIASIMELVNIIEKNPSEASLPVLKSLAQLIAPFAPHLAEEVWVEVLGQPFSIHNSEWPKYDDSLIDNDIVNIIIQINGKLRSSLKVSAADSKDEEIVTKLAKEDPGTVKWLGDGEIKKTVFVAGKLINFVV